MKPGSIATFVAPSRGHTLSRVTEVLGSGGDDGRDLCIDLPHPNEGAEDDPTVGRLGGSRLVLSGGAAGMIRERSDEKTITLASIILGKVSNLEVTSDYVVWWGQELFPLPC